MTRILVFFPHNPFPPRSGAHRRCLQILDGLHSLGAEIHFASSTHTSDAAWANTNADELHAAGISRLYLHQSNQWDARYIKYMHKFYHRARRIPPLDSANYAPPSLVRWFRRLTNEVRPKFILMNYAFWGRLVSPAMQRAYPTAIDMHDFISLYRPRFLLMERYLASPPFSPARTDPQFLQEDFFDAHHFEIDPAEYAIYDQYKYTIAITGADAALVKQHTHHTQVVTIPMTQEAVMLDNQYDRAALYTPGRNPFNIQGYLYFAARVLPRILEREPSFRLRVTGSVCDDLEATPGIDLAGFVSNLTGAYAHAPFLICPILGKTGQQIKIVEAMAHGVPVIATAAAAGGSPIRHGENGFIAQDASEFADHAVRLWQDRALCRKMGAAARAAIAAEYSQARLLEGLRQILDLPAA